jgi:hypothetical protein
MTFGAKTVIFVSRTGTGVFDEAGQEVMTTTEVPVTGCRHRPLNATETPEWLSDIATIIWKTTAPPQAAAIAATSTGQLKVDGVTYQIVGGAQPFDDFTASTFKVTILSKIEAG